MSKLNLLFSLLITSIISFHCTERDSNDSDGYLVQEKKKYVILKQDTVYIKERGKVLTYKKLGADSYYVITYKSSEPETDFGVLRLLVKDRKNKTLWQLLLSKYSLVTSSDESLL